MTSQDIAWQRLHNQHLVGSKLRKAEDVVRLLCVMQAEDYPSAKWAVAQRSVGLTDADLDQALADGSIIRTHAMRPTWQFVTPADLRWLLMLTAPRIDKLNTYWYRKVGLTDAIFAKSQAVLKRILKGGKQLTRAEISEALRQAGIETTGMPLRFPYILMRAEIDMIICSGALSGKQHTYALFDERVPKTKPLKRDEALTEFVMRFFTAHGPATLRDFALWSGLTMADVKQGFEIVRSKLYSIEVEGLTLWFAKGMKLAKLESPHVRLIPALDEYFIGYHDYVALLMDPVHRQAVADAGAQTILVDGRVAGVWKKTIGKQQATIALNLFTALTESQKQALDAERKRYGQFLGMPVTWA